MAEMSLTDRLPTVLELDTAAFRYTGFEDIIDEGEPIETGFLCELEDGTSTSHDHRTEPVLAESVENAEKAKESGSLLGRVSDGLFGRGSDEVEEALLVGIVTDDRLLIGSTIAVDESVELDHERLVSTAASGERLTVTYADPERVLEFELLKGRSPNAVGVTATLEEATEGREGHGEAPTESQSTEGDTSSPETGGGSIPTTESAADDAAGDPSATDANEETRAVEAEPPEGEVRDETGDGAEADGERFGWLAEQEASMAADPEQYLHELEATVCRVLSGMTDPQQAAATLARTHTGACLLGARSEGEIDHRRIDALVTRIDDALAFLNENEVELAALQSDATAAAPDVTTPDKTATRELLMAAATVGFTVTRLAEKADLETGTWTLDSQSASAPAPRTPAGPAQPAVRDRPTGHRSGVDPSPDEIGPGSDTPARSTLTELYEAFSRYQQVLDAIVSAADDGTRSPTERWCDEVAAVVGGGAGREAPGYGSQQASRAPATASEYREAYGDGEAVTSFAAVDVSPLPEYIPTVLDSIGESAEHGLRPHAPESSEPLPVLVESEAELTAAKRLLSEFPEEPPVGCQ